MPRPLTAWVVALVSVDLDVNQSHGLLLTLDALSDISARRPECSTGCNPRFGWSKEDLVLSWGNRRKCRAGSRSEPWTHSCGYQRQDKTRHISNAIGRRWRPPPVGDIIEI